MAGSTAGRAAIAAAKLSIAVVAAGLLVAGLMLPFVGGIGVAARNSVRSFEEQPCNINPVPPPQKSVIYAADGKTPIASFFSQNRTVVPLSSIPAVVRKAVVAIEDRRFYDHHGVDVQGLARAVVRNSQSGRIQQGGSTLTMQYVKLFRQYSAKTKAEKDAAVAQTPARKLIDARCALTLEQKLKKDDILARYLNIAYFGFGAYGIDTAARTLFGRPISKVSLEQAALLAGLVQSPSRYDPYRDPKAAAARRNTVLDGMRSLGYISAAQATKAKATPLKIARKTSPRQDCANANASITNAGFFCDYLKTYLARIGYPQSRLESGGFRIVTTLDARVQRSAQRAVYDRMPPDRRATSIMDVVDPTSGKVRAMAVSKKYGNNKKDKRQTTLRLPTLPAAGAGSTYKLFTMLAALQQKVPLRDFTIKVGNEYTPTNCGTGERITPVANAGRYPDKPYDLEEATYASVNTFFVALLDQQFACDLAEPVAVALKLGMNSLKSVKPTAQTIVNGQQYSFTLGPMGTSPLELTTAYGVLANQGKYCPPTPVEKILDSSGRQVALPERSCAQVLDPAIANTAAQVLIKDTKPGYAGTANSRFGEWYSAGLGPVAGKTGTSSADGVDKGLNAAAWFVGFTPNYAAAVATFNPDKPNSALRDVPGYGGAGDDVFGSFGATIWTRAMAPILQGDSWAFPPEDPTVVNGRSVPVPTVTGMDVATASATLAAAGFGIDVAGERKDSPYPPDRIAEQSPSGRALPGQTVTVYLSTGKAGQPTAQPGPGPGPAPQPSPPRRRPRPPGTP